MRNVASRICWVLITLSILTAAKVRADELETHPAATALNQVFTGPAPVDFKPSGVSRAEYLELIAGAVDFFARHQDPAGAIIDPVSKGERQYSTPAFAAAAGLLVKEAKRSDLLDPATRAVSCALTALVERRAADHHADFYIPLLVHAFRSLQDVVPLEQRQAWSDQFKRIDPEVTYRADLRGMNWNIVSCSGELLRRRDGLVTEEKLAPQLAYLEKCLAGHLDRLTPLGLFEDPGSPMAYDAFSRLWLEDVLADSAYDGAHAERIRAFLRTGGLSTLLLLSPTGEWASGGRSGLHNWADAQIVAICEINAVHWKRRGRDDVAGAFKRAAHLAFQSAARWRRPGGDLWIIKNRAEPTKRLGYEHYSHHSQYNLLPMAMLAIAYDRADDSIDERPTPAEVGGYVFDVRKTFHKVAAAAGGYYVLIDTAADAHYNATGLQRVHRVGVPLSALSDSAAGDRAYGPNEAPKAAIALGIEWKDDEPNGQWLGLADFSRGEERRIVRTVNLDVRSSHRDRVEFALTYDLSGDGQRGRTLCEKYVLTADAVEQTSSVDGKASAFRAHVPVLVSDGASDMVVEMGDTAFTVSQEESVTSVQFDPADVVRGVKLEGPRVVTHNGYVREAVVGVRSHTVTARIKLIQARGR